MLKAPAPICCLLRLAHLPLPLVQELSGVQRSSSGTRGGQQCHPLDTEREALVSPDSGEWEAPLIAAAFPQQGVAVVILGFKFPFKSRRRQPVVHSRGLLMCVPCAGLAATSRACPCPCCHTPATPARPKGVPALPPPQNEVKTEDNKMETRVPGARRLPARTQSTLLLLAL